MERVCGGPVEEGVGWKEGWAGGGGEEGGGEAGLEEGETTSLVACKCGEWRLESMRFGTSN